MSMGGPRGEGDDKAIFMFWIGVTTIAGGKSTRSGDMHDPSDDA